MIRYTLSFFAVLSLLFIPGKSLLAQEIPGTVSAATTTGSTADGSELQSCFDYYRFGSTPIVLQSETLRVAQGGDLKLTGTITNENQYPIDDATVYAKVFYKKNFDKNSFGPDVVDWFVLAGHVDLKAGEVRALSYTWKVPANAEPGFYQVATYVASHDRFNLAGLTFSNDVVGNLLNFSVAGDDQGTVRFDNTQTVLNGVGFHAAIFPPHSDTSQDGVPLSAVVSNTTGAAYSGTIHWQLYSWDAINQQNLLDESDTKVSVPAHGSTTVSYSVKDADHTVYYIIGTLDSGKGMAKSLLTVRYISSGSESHDLPRLAFVGATAYPSVGGDTRAFACFHSTGTRPSENMRVDLSVRPLDPWSWLVHFGSLGKNSYKGSAPGEVSALALPIKGASHDFAVTAALYQDGKLIDQVTTKYSCHTFSDSCPVSGWVYIAVLAVIVVLILGALLYVVRRRANHAPVSIPPTSA